MSSIATAKITSLDGTTDLTLATANTTSGNVILFAGNSNILFDGSPIFTGTPTFYQTLPFSGDLSLSGNLIFDTAKSTRIWDPSANNLAFYTTQTERIRIDSSGNVLVGRTNSVVGNNVKLDVAGAVNASSYVVTNNVAFDTISSAVIKSPSSNVITISTSQSEKMRITANGDVSIGTTSPSNTAGYTTLTVGGTSNGDISLKYSNNVLGLELVTYKGEIVANDAQDIIGYDSSGTRQWYIGYDGLFEAYGLYVATSVSQPISFWAGDTAQNMTIETTGNVLIGRTNSVKGLGVKLDVAGSVNAASYYDDTGPLREIPVNNKSAAYGLILTDVGKIISTSASGSNVYVPNTVFSGGQAVTVWNNSSGSITVTQNSSVTMYYAASAATGNRTLAQRGFCTITCLAANTFVIAGAGLT